LTEKKILDVDALLDATNEGSDVSKESDAETEYV